MNVSTRVTELAFLSIRPGAGEAFEAAFTSVAGLVAEAEGYLGHRLVRSLDQPDVYLLDVEWKDLAAHVEVFEPSDAHARFMAALTPFLAAEPRVIHVPSHGIDD
ncbi:antibiotic biosynthesis monooxygenase family protein [Pseudoxanthomonas sp. PXM02]|uniref:antibiotic biosynthesis monooxygenase family protein n=1 Tax=Pseudoxanthomonas sp. PXM02 TaxID=2769294 RepID=UPI00177C703E|nr:antibiotic biosynthesis monooxygenase family protein [Pseudoxanthomonas sp. PXM02]MBD9480147.1 antibiotic biosynthesis monooxygenase [Pseudoxanthomonas sp. PXM02]